MENGNTDAASAEINTINTTRAGGDGETSAVKSGEEPHAEESIPNGVACFPDSVEKPEGSALQSLRLSIPMQETELCKHTTSYCP
ncbi:hypothetical protein PGIGA_G00145120 [Pangasianodon gigas]|uniref:Uncharacterized protein n=1 Tax=Pangasianodon gigas TaxID=30993 RepID=A0ACC5XNL0_PANGG|nr:hypothetical protein [Pangasianodon gigas]